MLIKGGLRMEWVGGWGGEGGAISVTCNVSN